MSGNQADFGGDVGDHFGDDFGWNWDDDNDKSKLFCFFHLENQIIQQN